MARTTQIASVVGELYVLSKANGKIWRMKGPPR
jgi:hypothetical protein